jgi:serine/threonine protein kinase
VRLPDGTEIENQVTNEVYILENYLAHGGFGTAYLARKLRGSRRFGAPGCVKLTTDADSWHGEAYYGSLLRGRSNVVQQDDAFPTSVVTGGRCRAASALVMQYIETGTVHDACSDGRLPWPEDRVARKVRSLLKPLSLLHDVGVAHRDITPRNVFVGNRASLLLGDYGIARVGLKTSGIRADVANWVFAPSDIGAFWRPADDVYQVGLLMMTLLHGDEVTNDYGAIAVNRLTSRDFGLREIVKTAIGPRSRRFANAGELAAALPRGR